MVTEREVGTILAEIRHLAERQREHADTTLRMFSENSVENMRRFDQIDEKIQSSSEKVEVLNNSIQRQQVINKVGIWGATGIIGAIGLIGLALFGWIPGLVHWLVTLGKP